MKLKLIQEHQGRVYAVALEKGDEFINCMMRLSKERGFSSSYLSAIGAFNQATLAYFDRERMDYRKIPLEEQVEVVALGGNIALRGDDPIVHVHAIVSRADGSTVGGHLMEAHVWPTLEVFVFESPVGLHRKLDEETGLPLLELKA